LTEACVVFAIVRGEPIPSPDDIEVDEAPYLNGLAEAASELRRRCLDLIRRDRVAEAESMLTAMDDIYAQLVTIDFPDALTGGLRRTTDTLRAVLERTRGDLTTTLQQEKLQKALNEMERRVAGE
jgi:translin